MKKALLLVCGFLLLGVGGIGLFLPVWPTTPFVLLAVACFSASPALRARILRVRFINEHYYNYKNRTGLRPRTLAVSLAFLWGMLLLSMFLLNQTWAYIFLCGVGAAVTVHLAYMAKKRNQPAEETPATAEK